MADLRTRIFTGTDEHDATAQLLTAIQDGSFPVLDVMGIPVMWITHVHIGSETMQLPYYELHVTAWIKADVDAVQAEIEALHEAQP